MPATSPSFRWVDALVFDHRRAFHPRLVAEVTNLPVAIELVASFPAVADGIESWDQRLRLAHELVVPLWIEFHAEDRLIGRRTPVEVNAAVIVHEQFGVGVIRKVAEFRPLPRRGIARGVERLADGMRHQPGIADHHDGRRVTLGGKTRRFHQVPMHHVLRAEIAAHLGREEPIGALVMDQGRVRRLAQRRAFGQFVVREGEVIGQIDRIAVGQRPLGGVQRGRQNGQQCEKSASTFAPRSGTEQHPFAPHAEIIFPLKSGFPRCGILKWLFVPHSASVSVD